MLYGETKVMVYTTISIIVKNHLTNRLPLYFISKLAMNKDTGDILIIICLEITIIFKILLKTIYRNSIFESWKLYISSFPIYQNDLTFDKTKFAVVSSN